MSVYIYQCVGDSRTYCTGKYDSKCNAKKQWNAQC